MKIHKTWRLVTSKIEKIREKSLIKKMNELNMSFGVIDNMDFEFLTQSFEDKSPIKPSDYLIDHLSNLAQ